MVNHNPPAQAPSTPQQLLVSPTSPSQPTTQPNSTDIEAFRNELEEHKRGVDSRVRQWDTWIKAATIIFSIVGPIGGWVVAHEIGFTEERIAALDISVVDLYKEQRNQIEERDKKIFEMYEREASLRQKSANENSRKVKRPSRDPE